MKKLILIALFTFTGIILSVNAQQKISTVNMFKPYWYVGGNLGIDLFLGEGNNFFNPLLGNNKPYIFDLQHNTSFLGRAALGYNFTPVFGLRGMLGLVGTQWPNASVANIYNFSSENLNIDAMFNLSNAKGYNPNRKFDFLIFAGLGMGLRNQTLFPNNPLSPISGLLHGGLEGDFHLSNSLLLNLILDANITTDNYNDLSLTPLPFDVYPALSLGLTYKLPESVKKVAKTPETKPEEKPTPEVTPTPEPAQVAKEEPKPAVQPTPEPVQVAKEEPKPVVQPVEPKQPEVAVVPAPAPAPAIQATELWVNIFYPINGKTIIKERQMAAINRVADYMNANPNSKIIVTGYADRATGTAGINKWVSKQRALNVATILKNKYAIATERIQTNWKGDKVQIFKQDNMNRLTTIHTEGAQPFKRIKTVQSSKTIVKSTSSTSAIDSPLKVEITFNNESVSVSEQQQDMVMKVALYLRRHPDAKIIVSGYSEKNSGDAAQQVDLSKKRAVNISNSLILKYSISKNRIQVKWFGSGMKPNGNGNNNLVIISSVK